MVRSWVPLSDTEAEVLDILRGSRGQRLTAVEVSDKLRALTVYAVQRARRVLRSLEKSGKVRGRFRATVGRGRPSREYWLPDEN